MCKVSACEHILLWQKYYTALVKMYRIHSITSARRSHRWFLTSANIVILISCHHVAVLPRTGQWHMYRFNLLWIAKKKSVRCMITVQFVGCVQIVSHLNSNAENYRKVASLKKRKHILGMVLGVSGTNWGAKLIAWHYCVHSPDCSLKEYFKICILKFRK